MLGLAAEPDASVSRCAVLLLQHQQPRACHRLTWLFLAVSDSGRVRQTGRQTEGGRRGQELQSRGYIHGAAGRTFKVHLARVHGAGRGPERKSVQVSAEGKHIFSLARSLINRETANFTFTFTLWRASFPLVKSSRTCSSSLITTVRVFRCFTGERLRAGRSPPEKVPGNLRWNSKNGIKGQKKKMTRAKKCVRLEAKPHNPTFCTWNLTIKLK